ncbi:hypothetical protein [Actinomadura macrotermitis]|uniref:HEAT repeat domain-containing protein n=1 Tax=Actinomadura macrotermitis TaxID=2585200 RepID=A0A7K0C4L8_9ACTN|nr:hypothetical protein [Actinomadura macrotermitis]MQY07764.1 hypothetical protein [Actinomadura macrotermitis]
MTADALLAEVEPLPHRERRRRLAALRDVAALLDDLNGRGHYERSLALSVAASVRDEASLAHIARAAHDPDAGLAATAVHLAVRYGLDPGLGDDAPSALRRAFYQAVRKWHRAGLAEALIERTGERWGAAEAAALLPACGEDTVRRRLPGLADAVPNWRTLGRAHPGPVLDHAEGTLAELPESALPAWWSRYGPGLAAAAPHAPERVLGLLERYWRTGPFPHALKRRIGLLLDADRDRTLRLLLDPGRLPGLRTVLARRAIRDRVAAFGDDDVAALARAVRDDEQALRLLLRAFPPSRRERVFALATDGRDLATAVFGDALLDVLPAAVRVREARRMLGLRRIATSPRRTWETTAFLPYDEALPVLGDLARRPDADERATGYRLLIACAGRARDPRVLTRLLETLGRLRNEQDPVRSAALGALARIPPGLLNADHAVLVAQFTDDALGARDCSYATRSALAALAALFCRQGAARSDGDLLAFGLDTYAKVAESVSLGRLERTLRRGQEHELAALMAPRLEAGRRRGDHRLALDLAAALGRRAHRLPVVQDALEAALSAREDATVRRAAALWLAPPGPRGERVARVLAGDASTIALPEVFAAVASERTDLLHLALTGAPHEGRFRAPVVPLAQPSWMRRWTAAQHRRYLLLLRRLAGDAGSREHERVQAVHLIAGVPGAGVADLERHLKYDVLRRAALTAMPWTSRPQDALPLLLSHASSDDAHVALYAAARAARYAAPSALSAVLAPVIADGKITARKEALRILLRERVPDAVAVLAAAWDAPDQHRDVRGAIASALRPRLADPVAARILAEAAAGPRDVARHVLGTHPLSLPERLRPGYAALIVRVARSTDPEAQAAAIPALGPWAPWAPDVTAVPAGLAADLDCANWREALHALVACVAGGHGADDLAAAASRLAAAPALPDAGAERDRPAEQRLAALADQVAALSHRDPRGAARVVRALEGRLPEPLAGRLAAAALRWDDPSAGPAVDALAGRRFGGVLAVRHVAAALAWSGPHLGPRPDPALALPHAARLAARGDLTGGLFACALAGEHGERAGWPAEWRALLRDLRAHPHEDVAFAAREIRTALE